MADFEPLFGRNVIDSLSLVLTAAVANGGNFTVSYPGGRSAANYAATGAVLSIASMQASFSDQNSLDPSGAAKLSIVYGVSNITVTYNGATTIPINTPIKLSLPGPNSNNPPAVAAIVDNSGGVAATTFTVAVNLDALTDSSGGTPGTTFTAAVNLDTLTDSSGGTFSATIANVGGAYSQAVIANAFATFAAEIAKQKTLNTQLLNNISQLAVENGKQRTLNAQFLNNISQLASSVNGILSAIRVANLVQ